MTYALTSTIRPALTWTFAALAALLATACAQPPGPPAAAPASLASALPAYDWDLSAAYDARGQRQPDLPLPEQRPPQLQFGADRLTMQHLCNAISAGYRLTGERLEVGQGVMTRRLCADPALMALEQRLAAQLPQAEQLELLRGDGTAAPRLVLRFADGARWELAGVPTPATRHGAPGERMFLKVAPDTVPCAPATPNAPCLRVRELRYDSQGLRQSAGAWYVLQGGIEGFAHEPGLPKVLRVQCFPTPAGRACALDMVVETERMR